MAASADLGRKQAELCVGWPLYIMRVMAVYAGWHVRIAFANQGCTVDAVFIKIKDL